MNRKTNQKARGRKTLRQKTSNAAMPNELSLNRRYGGSPLSHNLTRHLIVPPSMDVRLRYNINQRLNSPGVDAASYSWNANGIYDVDPALASTAVPGFAEWMGLYRTYQVISTHANIDVINVIDEPTQVEFTWVDSPQAVNTFLPNRYGNSYATQKYISGKSGMDRCHYQRTMDMAQLNGSLTYWGTVSQFQGSASTNPLTPYQFVIGINSITGGVDADAYALGYLEFTVRLSNINIVAI